MVIAIIAILASLLMPSLDKAKRAAKNTACKSNMHQLGLALTMYADDFNAYPYALDWPVTMFWYDALAPYYSSNRALLGCPAFKGNRNVDEAVKWLGTSFFYYTPAEPGVLQNGVSYGYNAYGIASSGHIWSDNKVLGLGPSRPADGSVILPIKPADVRASADMIAAGDSMYMPVTTNQTFSYMLTIGDGARFSPDRHNGGLNIAYVDGHAQSVLVKRLAADDDTARRRWNSDHEPHWELPIPKLP